MTHDIAVHGSDAAGNDAAAFTIVGHRGAMAVEPENTMRSFATAAELGVDAIELDVHLSRDGRLVIMHDETVDRTTDGTGAIAELDWADLRRLDAGLGEQVPELAEVWASLDGVGLQIEVKSAAATAAVLELDRTSRHRGRPTTITSFDPDVVREASQQPRPWRVGLIFGQDEEGKLVEHLDADVDQLMINWALSTTPAARTHQTRGGVASVWISRTPQDVWRAIDEGWAETTVDDPEMALTARAAYRPGISAGA